MKKQLLIVFTLLLMPNLSFNTLACTGGLALGLTCAEGNVLLANLDWTVPVELDRLTLKLIVPEDKSKFRYLSAQKAAQLLGGTYLNEKGVGTKAFFRVSQSLKLPDENLIPTTDEVMTTCGSAKEMIDKLSGMFTKIGSTLSSGGLALLIVDPKDGYLIEASNYIYNSKLNHAVYGPMKDTVFAQANFYLDKNLRKYQIGSGAGYSRAQAMWELLIKNQYNDYNLNPIQGSGLVLPYMMDILKYHDKEVSMLENERDTSYTVNNNKSINIQGSVEKTYNSVIINPSADYIEYLSTMWLTFGEPDICPFLPFFIGINEVPKEYSSTVAAEKFNKLRTLLLTNTEHRERIVEYWKGQEVETISLYRGIVADAAVMLADKNDKNTDTAVRKKLTDFVNERCATALKTVDEIIKELESQKILTVSSRL